MNQEEYKKSVEDLKIEGLSDLEKAQTYWDNIKKTEWYCGISEESKALYEKYPPYKFYMFKDQPTSVLRMRGVSDKKLNFVQCMPFISQYCANIDEELIQEVESWSPEQLETIALNMYYDVWTKNTGFLQLTQIEVVGAPTAP